MKKGGKSGDALSPKTRGCPAVEIGTEFRAASAPVKQRPLGAAGEPRASSANVGTADGARFGDRAHDVRVAHGEGVEIDRGRHGERLARYPARSRHGYEWPHSAYDEEISDLPQRTVAANKEDTVEARHRGGGFTVGRGCGGGGGGDGYGGRCVWAEAAAAGVRCGRGSSDGRVDSDVERLLDAHGHGHERPGAAAGENGAAADGRPPAALAADDPQARDRTDLPTPRPSAGHPPRQPFQLRYSAAPSPVPSALLPLPSTTASSDAPAPEPSSSPQPAYPSAPGSSAVRPSLPSSCSPRSSSQVGGGHLKNVEVAPPYSRSPKNPALQQLQKSSQSASATPQRPIWNSFATVGVRDFWENGCRHSIEGSKSGQP